MNPDDQTEARMTTSPNTEDQTPEQAIREAAWQEALTLYEQYDAAADRSSGRGRAGYRHMHAEAETLRLYTLLTATVAEHGFAGTYVDPALSWGARRSASSECPPAVTA